MWYKNVGTRFFHLAQIARLISQTDGRTGSFLLARSLHVMHACMRRSKKQQFYAVLGHSILAFREMWSFYFYC